MHPVRFDVARLACHKRDRRAVFLALLAVELYDHLSFHNDCRVVTFNVRCAIVVLHFLESRMHPLPLLPRPPSPSLSLEGTP